MEHEIIIADISADFVENKNAEEGHQKAMKVKITDVNGDIYCFEICECGQGATEGFFDMNLKIFRAWIDTDKFPKKLFEQEGVSVNPDNCTA